MTTHLICYDDPETTEPDLELGPDETPTVPDRRLPDGFREFLASFEDESSAETQH